MGLLPDVLAGTGSDRAGAGSFLVAGSGWLVRRVRVVHTQRAPRRTTRPYTLRGLLYCGICDRRIQGGSWNNDAAYYRCVFLNQYAAKNKIDHGELHRQVWQSALANRAENGTLPGDEAIALPTAAANGGVGS